MSINEQQRIKTTANGTVLLLIGILIFAANLRAPLTAVGPLVPIIRDHFMISNTAIGTLTTLPLLAFALISPISPKIANRFGMERTIFVSIIILMLGIMIRSLSGTSTLFIGTIFIGIAIAFGNVLLPGLIKLTFPFRIGLLTGLYAVCMNIFAAISTGISVPLSNMKLSGWQGALGIWALLAVIAIFLWLPRVKHPAQLSDYDVDQEYKKVNFWKSLTAWQITLFMGIQSLMYYTIMTWLPDILLTQGYNVSEAGWLLSLMQFSLIPLTFIMPVIAGKMKNQVVLAAMVGSFFIIGVIGFLSGNSIFIILSVILWGAACGGAFSLSMIFFTLRTKDAYEASDLSGMAQSMGYLLAAAGPVIFGGLHDLFDTWISPLVLLLILAVIILVCGMLLKEGIL